MRTFFPIATSAVTLFTTFLFFLCVSFSAQAQTSRERLDALIKRANVETPAAPATPAAASPTRPAVPAALPAAVATTLPPPVPGATQTVIVTEEEPSPYDVPKPKPPTLRDRAFKELLDKISPLTPEQIIEMRKAQDRTQRAVATLPDTPPRPVSSTLTIDLSPGVTPPVIRLGAGFVTSLVFVDSTGQSWPIADYSLGNPKNFNIQWDRKTNTLFIQSTTAYNSGNLAVRLATLDTPVMLSLVSGQREVDYRVDLQVRGRGPNATAALVGDGLPAAPKPILLSVLDGVPPPGSLELQVTGGCGRAWMYKGKMIFRTHLTLLSPAWIATISSLDGTRVYEMNPTPLILATQNGKTIKIGVTGL